MEGPNFRLTFLPKQGDAIGHLAKLIDKEEINSLVSTILLNNKIRPNQISIRPSEKGRGKKGEVFEGFHYKKYLGKLSGEKKKFMGSTPFITRFELSLLKSKTKDGLMIKSMDNHGSADTKVVTDGLYHELLSKISEAGPVQWNNIVKTGTF
jgi:hypothetical protein